MLIEDSGERFVCHPERTLLRSMECLGRKGIPVGCRNGGCGVCKVRVTEGRFRAEKMSRACVSFEEEQDGVILACRIYPETDLRLRVLGKMIKAVMSGCDNETGPTSGA